MERPWGKKEGITGPKDASASASVATREIIAEGNLLACTPPGQNHTLRSAERGLVRRLHPVLLALFFLHPFRE